MRVRWYHQLSGHTLEQTPGDGAGQGSLACCGPWGCKESDTPERLSNRSKVSQVEAVSTIYLVHRVYPRRDPARLTGKGG